MYEIIKRQHSMHYHNDTVLTKLADKEVAESFVAVMNDLADQINALTDESDSLEYFIEEV